MQEIFTRKAKKPGLDPGTLVHVGKRRTDKVKITILDYDEEHCEEKEAKSVDECLPFRNRPTVTWINIDGIHQVDVIEKIGTNYGVHPLLLEDILHTTQRPKAEDFYTYVYIVLKMLSRNEKDDIEVEQISLILGDNFVITFQETIGDVFDPVRERIRNNKGRTRKMGADYLAYSLIDTIVDNYFVILEGLGEEIEALEEEVVTSPTKETLQDIHASKRDMLILRKSVWPLREVISGLQRGESALFKKGTLVYLRDVYDHTIQVIETVEAYRDMVAGMMDIYLSSISNRLNEVMKVLTIIATIFMPLTFLSGVYGMNFVYMWPKEEYWGYPALLGIMAAVAGIMLYVFRRRKWL
jgi:magnesium transporter